MTNDVLCGLFSILYNMVSTSIIDVSDNSYGNLFTNQYLGYK